NLFRASGRHLFEFTFAIAVLAGMGASRLAEPDTLDRATVLRVARRGMVTLAAIVIVVVIVYRFFQHLLVMPERPLPLGAGSLKNAELLVTLLFFVLSVAMLRLAARRWSAQIGAAMVVLLCLDVAHFGCYYEWRITPRNLMESLADPPAVKLIKEREPDLNSFRIIGHSPDPHGKNYETLNFPNVSIVRGLQSVNGYDPLRIVRMMRLAGHLSIDGRVGEPQVFGATDQSLNLLNVKYLLHERTEAGGQEETLEHDSIRFFRKKDNFKLRPGVRELVSVKATATELAIISTMGDSLDIPNGAPVVRIKLHTTGGSVIERELQAGRDTSEWAHDRARPLGKIKHDCARVIESWPAGGFEGHRYLARLAFDRAEIERVEFEYVADGADLTIAHVALYDAMTGESRPLDMMLAPPERWRLLGRFGEVELFENLKLLPRAWFVRSLAVAPEEEVLQTIKSGRMKDGAAFDPAEVALFAREDFGFRDVVLPPAGETKEARVRITRYQPQRIELQTSNRQPGFLVLSETYYRGWEARIDGKRAPVERVNYALRGLAVPAGEHRIEFVFQSPSFRKGAVFSATGLILLLAGWVSSRRSRLLNPPR
ncbi:MAG: YfhO family protein, partial [Blastocatellia bacterium]